MKTPIDPDLEVASEAHSTVGRSSKGAHQLHVHSLSGGPVGGRAFALFHAFNQAATLALGSLVPFRGVGRDTRSATI